MSNQAYLQGVAEALSQMNVDSQIKVASYNELEKVALKGLRAGLASKLEGLGGKLMGEEAAAARKAHKDYIARRASHPQTGTGSSVDESMFLALKRRGEKAQQALKERGMLGSLGAGLENRSQATADALLGLGGAGLVGTGAYGINAALDDSDEVAAAELAAAELAAAEQADADRQRNLALALGGTALAGGLGYGAYKAMS